MPKLGMQSIRRRQLIDATLEAINEVGMHDATIAQIARRAGVSTGDHQPLFQGQKWSAGSNHARYHQSAA